MCDKDNASSCAICFLVGAAVGLAAGILYAPRPGRETREIIGEKTSVTRDKAGRIIQEARGKAEEIINKAKSKAAQIRRGSKPITSESESTEE